MKLDELINQFEKNYGAKVIYLTEYGSKLYGTNNKGSDTDIKGIFIQNTDDILLKNDINHFTQNTNNTKEKNGENDIDLQLFSINKFFSLLRKGETGALDILFSIWSPSVIYKDDTFMNFMKENYKLFLSKNLNSFVGYSVAMAGKYGVKGTRYQELHKLFEHLINRKDLLQNYDKKLGIYFNYISEYMKNNNFKYCKLTSAPGPKTGKGENLIEYLEVLGKKYSTDITIGYFMERLKELHDRYGNRSKKSADGVDWKAISHAVRIISEVEELIDTKFITFPLKNRKYVKSVKSGSEKIEYVMKYINEKLDIVKYKISHSNLPESVAKNITDPIELEMLLYYNEKMKG